MYYPLITMLQQSLNQDTLLSDNTLSRVIVIAYQRMLNMTKRRKKKIFIFSVVVRRKYLLRNACAHS